MKKLSRLFVLFVLIGFVPFASAKEANPVFGSYEAIVYDHDILQGVQVDGEGNVFIMFQPDKTDTQLVLRISMMKGAQYRDWYIGGTDFVSQANTGRAANVWTDRVQTVSNYIEYWADGKLFLHFKKIKG